MSLTTPKMFTVEGSGHFPLDMLRYDKCYPASSADVARIMDDRQRTIRLMTHARHAPSHGRWNSFLWGVTG